MPIEEQVVKGGICWFEMSIRRGKNGLHLSMKADPRIEEFIKTLGEGVEDLEIYGKDWVPMGKAKIRVYNLEKRFPNPGDGKFFLSRPSGGMIDYSTNLVNLSFLRFEGIGSREGVEFIAIGAYSRDYVDDLKVRVLNEVRNIVRDYIAPINVNLRISSQEI